MTSEEEHRRSIKELLDDISEKVRADLLIERQKLIGFSASEASCNMLALLLHKKDLITPGFNVNHRFFVSENIAEERLDFDFPDKGLLIGLMVKQERYRTLLCYGRSKEKKVIQEAIANMNRIRQAIERLLGEEI